MSIFFHIFFDRVFITFLHCIRLCNNYLSLCMDFSRRSRIFIFCLYLLFSVTIWPFCTRYSIWQYHKSFCAHVEADKCPFSTNVARLMSYFIFISVYKQLDWFEATVASVFKRHNINFFFWRPKHIEFANHCDSALANGSNTCTLIFWNICFMKNNALNHVPTSGCLWRWFKVLLGSVGWVGVGGGCSWYISLALQPALTYSDPDPILTWRHAAIGTCAVKCVYNVHLRPSTLITRIHLCISEGRILKWSLYTASINTEHISTGIWKMRSL